jgi:mRNA-degrading endonuclease toxin of MazEF toxin-antitoxin module
MGAVLSERPSVVIGAVLAKTRPSVVIRAALAKKKRNRTTVIWPSLD